MCHKRTDFLQLKSKMNIGCWPHITVEHLCYSIENNVDNNIITLAVAIAFLRGNAVEAILIQNN